MKFRKLAACLTAGMVALAGCSDVGMSPLAQDGGPSLAKKNGAPQDFVVVGQNGVLPAGFAADVAAAGGSVVTLHEDLGVAMVRSAAANFRSSVARLAGIETIAPDLVVDWVDPNARSVELTLQQAAQIHSIEAAATDLSIGTDEPYAFLQWALGAVQAPDAWEAGYTGQGARVAIIDGGIFDAHPDLAANIDRAASRSFTTGAYNTDVGALWHGTHVAGIVAAGDNGRGVIGIAPNATIIGVKALHDGSGSFSSIINAIAYAATPLAEGGAGADVINMSLGAMIDGKDKEFKKEVKELMKAVDAATKFAHQQGVVIIASAGNDGFNLDVDNELVKTPGQNAHVIATSSTGPIGWALGNTDFSRQSSYTDFGKALVDISAPGGDFALPGNDVCLVISPYAPVGINQFCWALDMYLSTSRGPATSAGSYTWSAGTSMAAPVATGIAALIIEKYGDIPPSEVEARLKGGALDLGKPGNDGVYGHGWVNAFGAIAN